MRMKRTSGRGIYSFSDRCVHYVMFVMLALLAFSCLYPFLLILSASFQTQESIYANGYRIFADKYTLETYKLIIKKQEVLINAYTITIITTVLTTIIGVVSVSGCGYVISRRDYKYNKVLTFYIFFTMLFSGGLTPTYIIITRWLGLKNSIWALVLPLCCSAWNIMLMKGFFVSIPTSLIESAKVDGAGEFLIFSKIVIPLAKPAVATITLFLVLGGWNDYQQSMLYLDDDKFVKLQYLLVKIMKNIEFLNSEEAFKYGVITEKIDVPTLGARMAMCVLSAGPIVAVFPFFQKYFTKGLTIGSVKG